MNAVFLDSEGQDRLMVMGCYGIGVGRTVAAAIEQNHDENGMTLPFAIAPFEVEVLPVNTSHAESMEIAESALQGAPRQRGRHDPRRQGGEARRQVQGL